jgi:hypothetical protein
MSLLCVYLSKRGKGVGIGGERRPKDIMKREGYFRDNFDVLQKLIIIIMQARDFLLSTLCSRHPQEELPKFGYRSQRDVEKFKNHAYI